MITLASACQMFSVLTHGLSEPTAHQHLGRPLVRAALFFFLPSSLAWSHFLSGLVCVDNHNCSLGGICVAPKDRGGKCSAATAAESGVVTLEISILKGPQWTGVEHTPPVNRGLEWGTLFQYPKTFYRDTHIKSMLICTFFLCLKQHSRVHTVPIVSDTVLILCENVKSSDGAKIRLQQAELLKSGVYLPKLLPLWYQIPTLSHWCLIFIFSSVWTVDSVSNNAFNVHTV